MRDFSELQAKIIENIKANGRGAITGTLLQEQLLSMIDSMELQSFNGIATPTTTPVVDTTAEHFYFAMQKGSYSAFKSGLKIEDGDFYLLYRLPDATTWTAVNFKQYFKGDSGKDGADGSLMWPSMGMNAQGELYVEVPDDETSTNLCIEDSYLCVKMPDLA